jgi:chromosome segregation ATPase
MDINNFEKPENYYAKLKDINDRNPFLLDEYKKLYVISNMNPSNEEYQLQFSNIDNSVKKVNTKLFSMSTDIKNNINKLTESIVSLDRDIQLQKEKKNELNKKLGIVEHKTNAASEMIYDYKQIYNERYLRNWAMGISIISGILVVKWMFKPPGV